MFRIKKQIIPSKKNIFSKKVLKLFEKFYITVKGGEKNGRKGKNV